MIKKVKVEDAVGMVLAHDMTKVIPDKFKGAAFKKGYIVLEEDIEELKSMGKNHIFILEINDDFIHENEASLRIAQAASNDFTLVGPAEGKVNFIANSTGLLKVDVNRLQEVNEIEDIVLATLKNDTLVEKGRMVASAKLIPLITKKEKIEEVERILASQSPVISFKAVKSYKVGIVITGTEVYEGIIKDKFEPVLRNKAKDFGCSVLGVKFAKDDFEMIKGCIDELIEDGAEIIITSGGMSVDPDDITPNAIKSVADEVITYGSPVIPGAMFMVAYKGDIPMLGLPACGMFFKITVLDIVFKKIIAGERLSKKYMASLAHGGLCDRCEVCHYPVCTFGS